MKRKKGKEQEESLPLVGWQAKNWDSYNEIQGGPNSYEDHVDFVGHEDVLANPDLLAASDDDAPTQNPYRELLQEAVLKLSKRQQEVWELCMRQKLSERKAADKLGLIRESVREFKKRAIQSVIKYCRANAHLIELKKNQGELE